MARVKDSEMVIYRGCKVSPKQSEFLDAMMELGDFNAACNVAGLTPSKVKNSLANSSSAFVVAYQKVMENLADDFNYSKVKNLSVLGNMRDKLEQALEEAMEQGDVKTASFLSQAAIKCTQEINKMIEGNLAAQKKVQENVNFKIEGVLDLTKGNDTKSIDVEYEDIDE